MTVPEIPQNPPSTTPAAPKKRPRGLKKSLANDPPQQDISTKEEPDSKKPKITESSSSELLISTTSSDPIIELTQVFEEALTKISENKFEEGILFLRGTVHECDLLVRRVHEGVDNDDNKDDADKEKLELTAEFHAVYARALYELGALAGHEVVLYDMEAQQRENENENENESGKDNQLPSETLDPETIAKDYTTAALERVKIGLESYPNDPTLNELEGKCLLRIGCLEGDSDAAFFGIEKLNIENCKSLDECADTVELILENLDKFSGGDSDNEDWDVCDDARLIILQPFLDVANKSPTPTAPESVFLSTRVLATFDLLTAEDLLQNHEPADANGLDSKTEFELLLASLDSYQITLNPLTKSLPTTSKPELFKLLGEIHLMKGNICDVLDNGRADFEYALAKEMFMVLLRLDPEAVPENVVEFLEGFGGGDDDDFEDDDE